MSSQTRGFTERTDDNDTHKSNFGFENAETFLRSMMVHVKDDGASLNRWMDRAVQDAQASSSTEVAKKRDPNKESSDEAVFMLQEEKYSILRNKRRA